MSQLLDQFRGGIHPLQNHRDLGVLETRQATYAARIVDYSQHGAPIVDPDSAGDILCSSHWGEASRAMGGWAHAWPVKGGSPVNATSRSNTDRVVAMAKNSARASGSVLGRGGGYVKNKDGSISAYLQIGIGLDPGGFDTLDGTRNAGGFGLPAGYFFGIDKQFAGLGGNYELVVYDGPTGVIEKMDAAALAARDAHRARDAQARDQGKGGAAPAGQFNGASGPLGPAGDAGSAAFGPGGAFGGNGRVVTGESAAGGTIRLNPIKNSGYAADTSFGTGTVNTPTGWPSIVIGSVGIVLGGTEHKKQEPVYIHGDPRMVSVNNGPDPGASSVVYDTDSTGAFDYNRKAKLHSAWRVLPPFSGSPAFGPGGTLAWQLTAGERDSVAGYGAVVDTSGTKGPKRPVTITPNGGTKVGSAPSTNTTQVAHAQSMAKSAMAAGQYGAAGYYAGMASWVSAQVKAAAVTLSSVAKAHANEGARAAVAGGVPNLTVGLTSARSGGFIEVGHGSKDKHVIGKSGDHNINAAHISTDALFYNDQELDAPIAFEEDPYPEVQAFPLKSKVHLQYNGSKYHSATAQAIGASNGVSGAGRKYRGLWEFWAEVPNTKEGGGEVPPPGITPPDDPPPPTTNVPPPTIARWRERLTIGGLPTLGFGNGGGFSLGGFSGSDGGGGRGGGGNGHGTVGAGSADLPTENPMGWTLATAVNQGRGGMYQKLDEAEPFVRVPGLDFGRVGGAMTMAPIPQSRLDTVRARDGVTERTDQFSGFPAATAHTVLLFRPQHTNRGYRDLRNAVNAPESIIRRQMADRPMTLRMEAFGQEYGQTWVKTQGAGKSRFEGGTGAGGIVVLPPELDLLDVERASYVPATSTSYFVAHPGVYWGSGYARAGSGDLKTGFRWGTDSTGILTFSAMDSAGVATAAFGANASALLFLRESGGTTLTVGSISDGSVLARSVNGIVGRTPSSGWGTPTGTLTRTTYDTATVTLPQLAERVAALITDLKLKGYLTA